MRVLSSKSEKFLRDVESQEARGSWGALALLIVLIGLMGYGTLHHLMARLSSLSGKKTANVQLIRPEPVVSKTPSPSINPIKERSTYPLSRQSPRSVEHAPGSSGSSREVQEESLDVASSALSGRDVFGLQQGNGQGLRIGAQGQGGNALLFFGQEIQRMATEAVRRVHIRDRVGLSALVVYLWLTPYGHIERKQIYHSSGSSDLDENVMRALDGLNGRFSHPPTGLPQPLKLRIQP